MKIYTTNEWKGYGKRNYFWNEYRREGNIINKIKCNRRKFFDGNENNWETSEELIDSWEIGDVSMPEWMNKYI